jgi:RNA polymerase sigma-70 factor (ECF subfamily)
MDAAAERPQEPDRMPQTGRSPAPAISDEELVRRVRADDQQAVEALVRRYRNKAFAIAYQMSGGNREDALDLTQDVFLRVFRKIHTFKGDASFYTWFYRIVVNACVDARRRRQRWRRIFSTRRPDAKESQGSLEDVPDRSDDANPLSKLSGKELNAEVQAAVKMLTESQRTAFQLKVFQDLSIAEIAEVMGLAPGTVKSHLFRATQFIRKRLDGWIA